MVFLNQTYYMFLEFLLYRGIYCTRKELYMIRSDKVYKRFYRRFTASEKLLGYSCYGKVQIGYDRINKNTSKALSCTSCIYREFNDSSGIDKSLKMITKEKNAEVQTLEPNNLRRIIEPLKNHPNDKKILHRVDAECCTILKDFSSSDIVNAIFYLHSILKNKIYDLHFYEESLKILKSSASKHGLKQSDIISLLQIFGYKKKVENEILPIFLMIIQIDQLSLAELYIVLNSTFRTSTMLHQRDINYIESLLETHGKDYETNQKLITVLCKVIRHMRPMKQYNLNKLSTRIMNNTQTFNLATCAHVLACYAELHCAHMEVVKRLMSDAIKCYAYANNTHLKELKRFVKKYKYLDNILWAGSTLNYSYQLDELIEIHKFIRNELTYLINEPNRLVNIILCLWILNYKLEEELNICFEKKAFMSVIENDILWKPKARLNLLVNCIKIESPKLKIPAEYLNDMHIGMDVPASVERVYEIVKGFSTQMQLCDIEVNCPIKGLYIAGVTFMHQTLGYFHINVLDDARCLTPIREPDGLMALKIRLLRKLGYRPITIDEDVLHNFEQAVTVVESCINEIFKTKE